MNTILTIISLKRLDIPEEAFLTGRENTLTSMMRRVTGLPLITEIKQVLI
jgi:hypothetical protein